MKHYDCGIDLGTTNSCVAIPADNATGYCIVEAKIKEPTTPSAVFIDSKGKLYVGKRAFKMFDDKDPQDLAVQFKRKMGTTDSIHFPSSGVDKGPEELSAEVLKKLKDDVLKVNNTDVKDVVITVPAAFTTLQCEATKRAGKLAGFENVVLLQEPIAASIAYGAKPENNSGDGNWMVFDYGGGTLDVAVISTIGGYLKVVNTEGDNFCGGSDIDRILYKEVILPELKAAGYEVAELLNEKTIEGRANVRKLQKICEEGKKQFITADVATIEIFDFEDDNGEDIDLECVLDKSRYNALIGETIDGCVDIAKKSLAGANLEAADLHKVVLVGGSTRIPLVKEKLEEAFGNIVDGSLDPMTVVAIGAAIYAGQTEVITSKETANTQKPTKKERCENCIQAIISADPTTAQDSLEIMGKLQNIGESGASEIKIIASDSADFSQIVFETDWEELVDGYTEDDRFFTIDVNVIRSEQGTENFYKIIVRNEHGVELQVEDGEFSVKGTMSAGLNFRDASTSTCSIGVKVVDSTGNVRLDFLIAKNTMLPVKATRTYRTTKDLDPAVESSIVIEIFEGENADDPKANHSAGCITIQSAAMKEMIPKDTEIEITVGEDAERTLTVEGYIPDFDYTIPAKTLRNEEKSRINTSAQVESAKHELGVFEETIQELKKSGVDTTQIEEDCKKAKETMESSGDDGEVNRALSSLGKMRSALQKAKEEQLRKTELAQMAQNCEYYQKMVSQYGNDFEREKINTLSERFYSESSADKRKSIVDEMCGVFNKMFWNSFELVKNYYLRYYDRNDNFSNLKSAEVYKEQAWDAIRKERVDELARAVQGLIMLQSRNTGRTQTVAYGADIKF